MELDAQAVIREKVKIKQKQNIVLAKKTVEDGPPLVFQIMGPLPFSATISGPGGSVSGSGGGTAQPLWEINLVAANGRYQIHAKTPLSAGQISNIGCTISWNGAGIFSEGHYIRNDSGEDAVVATDFFFTFNQLPIPPVDPGFDFTIV
jgi:hypothetical protein